MEIVWSHKRAHNRKWNKTINKGVMTSISVFSTHTYLSSFFIFSSMKSALKPTEQVGGKHTFTVKGKKNHHRSLSHQFQSVNSNGILFIYLKRNFSSNKNEHCWKYFVVRAIDVHLVCRLAEFQFTFIWNDLPKRLFLFVPECVFFFRSRQLIP